MVLVRFFEVTQFQYLSGDAMSTNNVVSMFHRDTQSIYRQREMELITLYEIGRIVDSAIVPKSMVREVLNVLSSHLNLYRCMISLVQTNGEVHAIGATGMTEDELERGRYKNGEGILGQIVRTGLPIVIPNVAEEPRFLNRTGSRPLSGEPAIAFLGVPIKALCGTFGVLSADRDMLTFLGSLQHDVRLLKTVATLISAPLQRLRNAFDGRVPPRPAPQSSTAPKPRLNNVIGQSREMREVFSEVERAAVVNSTVLLRGESGTGKEVIAQAIHRLSPRHDGPFIRVNCAALSETLLDSELFGHEKGAFTGANAERKGRFELADGGTIFLDEIGEISPAFQVKLLRVLQEREFERVGGNRSIKVDVRLIAATNRDLETAVTQGEFRADLYFRLNVISILLPALRERREDIPELVHHFLDRFNQVNDREIELSPEALHILSHCEWPGNVRELENCVERTAAMAPGKTIRDIHLACQKNQCFSMSLAATVQKDSPVPKMAGAMDETADPKKQRVAGARDHTVVSENLSPRDRLIWALEEAGWVQAKAARLLGMTTRQINYALEKYHIELKKL
jgi:Nif-specific regulatory protein